MKKEKKAPLKIVLTGGPCAGKTTIAEVVAHSFSNRLAVVPESASLLMRGGFPRWEGAQEHRAFQTAVFSVQKQIEEVYETRFSGSPLLLDRGTLDGAAYWPDGVAEFFRVMGTTAETELARYDHVIYLESAEKKDFEAHVHLNPTRLEDWTEAHRLDGATRKIWSAHPHISYIKSEEAFNAKISAVLELVRRFLA